MALRLSRHVIARRFSPVYADSEVVLLSARALYHSEIITDSRCRWVVHARGYPRQVADHQADSAPCTRTLSTMPRGSQSGQPARSIRCPAGAGNCRRAGTGGHCDFLARSHFVRAAFTQSPLGAWGRSKRGPGPGAWAASGRRRTRPGGPRPVPEVGLCQRTSGSILVAVMLTARAQVDFRKVPRGACGASNACASARAPSQYTS